MATRFPGAKTELYSEVIGQICLAFAIDKNKSMTMADFNLIEIKKLMKYMVFQSKVNFSDKTFLSELTEYGMMPISKGLTFIDAQGNNMKKLKNDFKITKRHKIYNDKLFSDKTVKKDNPYTAFIKSKQSAKADKWNPADIWVMTQKGVSNLAHMNSLVMSRAKNSLESANHFFAEQFTHRDIIPVSLKQPQASPHIEIVNSNEFVTRLVLNETENPTVEYTVGNKDVKVNFTVETIKLDKNQKASTARRNPQNIRGKVVKGSQKHIRLKYHVDNKKIELEYTQSGNYPTLAKAKMGNLGAANFQKIINKTSKQGVVALNKIQKKYSDIDIKTDPFFNAKQLGVTKARHSALELEPHYTRLSHYVSQLFEEITGSVPDFQKDPKLSKAEGLWNKSRAGEFGLAVSGISNHAAKRRVIQNLYETAASISYATGLTQSEQDMMEPSTRKVEFNACVYVKVF